MPLPDEHEPLIHVDLMYMGHHLRRWPNIKPINVLSPHDASQHPFPSLNNGFFTPKITPKIFIELF